MTRRSARLAARLETVGVRPLQAMAEAALAITDQTRDWAEAGGSVLHALIGHEIPRAGRHYPDGDTRDPAAGYRWYYHCHEDRQPAGEHGHFHLFAEQPAAGRQRTSLTHLVAIAVDAHGLPVRAFTCNRWVTGEVWRDAEQVLRRLARFRVASVDPALDAVGRWLAALTRLFAPQLQDLVNERDAAMARRAAGGRRPNLRDDRRLDVVSACRLSLPAQIEALQQRLLTRRKPHTPTAVRRASARVAHEVHAA